MNFFVTNSGLGYNETAILLLLDKKDSTYLVVEINAQETETSYKLGEICHMNDYEIMAIEYDIKTSELYTPLFEHLLKLIIYEIQQLKNYHPNQKSEFYISSKLLEEKLNLLLKI